MSPRKARRLPPSLPRKPRGGARRGAAGTAAGGGSDAEPAPVRLGPGQTQEWPDGDWMVRQVPGAASAKMYRCPGCDQEIMPGTAHVVVWPADTRGADQRRHWHNPCWQRRPRRPASGYRGRTRR